MLVSPQTVVALKLVLSADAFAGLVRPYLAYQAYMASLKRGIAH